MTNEHRGPIRDFIGERFPQAQLCDEDDIFELGFVNSLFATELVMFVEETFRLTIPNEELTRENFSSVTAMSELIDRLLSVGAESR